MKCFRHRESEALGICKNCSKGLCSGCLVDLNNGIACKNACAVATKARHTVLALSYCTMGFLFGSIAPINALQGLAPYVFWIASAVSFVIGIYYLYVAPRSTGKN